MQAFSANTTLNTADYHTVIFGEPTDLALVAGHKGLLGLEVVATGQAAHSGYPWLGESAVSAILPALSILDKLGDLPAADGGLPASPKYGRTTVNIGHVVAGVAANVVPASPSLRWRCAWPRARPRKRARSSARPWPTRRRPTIRMVWFWISRNMRALIRRRIWMSTCRGSL
ncbi:peptidase [Aspergillus ochraceoroseus]|uniref:Peptidase n=1 Tax=Aspergillus ochraceoroseus TaxID=138278 RepID=A0A0F8WVE1_9EURO|nr:peptidase [Aspergillus ochraceoroseus]